MSALVVNAEEKDNRRICAAINQLAQGRSNAVGTVTLTPSATSTVVSAETIGNDSRVQLTPTTANAAAAMATSYVSAVGIKTFTITHANNAQVDRTFYWHAPG